MIVNTVNRIHMERKTKMITVIHDFRCAEAPADKVIWIRDGVVYKQGGKELAQEYFHSQIPQELLNEYSELKISRTSLQRAGDFS